MPSWMKWFISLLIGLGIVALGWFKFPFVLNTFFVLICFVLIIVVLLQSGSAADLAGAFGGAGSQTAFNPRGTAGQLDIAEVLQAGAARAENSGSRNTDSASANPGAAASGFATAAAIAAAGAVVIGPSFAARADAPGKEALSGHSLAGCGAPGYNPISHLPRAEVAELADAPS